MLKRVFSSLTAALFLTALLAPAAKAQELAAVRDAEIENTIRAYATPIFTAAGLNPDSVRIILVNDPAINAFVAGGQNLFVTTGLLMQTDNAAQVIGVIAHETGHMAGGHLARMTEAMRKARLLSIISLVLGGAAVLASGGEGGAGQAVMAGGQGLALRSLLRYSQAQEQAADQGAVNYLDRVDLPATGLLQVLQKLSGQELLAASRQDPYLRTHPLTNDRIVFVRNHVANSPKSDAAIPTEFAYMHARMVAKLRGFLDPPARTFATYKADDSGLEARYARAIAYYRQQDLEKALPLVDGLIAEHPEDPYLHELKGQMLFENGRIRESVAAYRQAVKHLPDNALLRASLGQAELELNDDALVRDALAHLNEAVRIDREYAGAWRLLAIAYGRQGEIGMAALSLAERALLVGDGVEARQQASRAQKLLPRGSPGWVRAQDIKRTAEQS